jgi:dolichol-phosphate hexosyltransferase
MMQENEDNFVFQQAGSQTKAEVIIAALNEEEGVGLTIMEMSKKLRNQPITVVDGNSRDRTVEVAKNCGARILFQEGKGKGDAISMALKYLEPNTKYVILTDADYTYPAESIPQMIQILEDNPNVGMVCGNRFSEQKEKGALKNRFYMGNKLLAVAHTILNGIELKDPLTGLRVIRAEILASFPLKSKGFDVEVEINHQVMRKGFKTVEIPIGYRTRLGEKKLKMKHGATILKRIILETYR